MQTTTKTNTPHHCRALQTMAAAQRQVCLQRKWGVAESEPVVGSAVATRPEFRGSATHVSTSGNTTHEWKSVAIFNCMPQHYIHIMYCSKTFHYKRYTKYILFITMLPNRITPNHVITLTAKSPNTEREQSANFGPT
jgi:hypothetical protein